VMGPFSPRLVAGLLLASALFGSACGSDDGSVDRAKKRDIAELDATIPLSLNGLDVVEEDIAETLDSAQRPYLAAAGLYSFREDDLLQATLQIGRFADDVDEEDETFVDRLVNRVSAGARKVRMGNQLLYVGGADRQTLTMWLEDGHMFLLSTRDGFAGGRALLREALEIQP
jgi:hypothetical protein